MKNIKEELKEFLREEATDEQFKDFVYWWVGEDYLIELVEEGITNYPDEEELKELLKDLKSNQIK